LITDVVADVQDGRDVDTRTDTSDRHPTNVGRERGRCRIVGRACRESRLCRPILRAHQAELAVLPIHMRPRTQQQPSSRRLARSGFCHGSPAQIAGSQQPCPAP
jgi:hypothetical protein